MYVVLLNIGDDPLRDSEAFGPFADENECYDFAAKVSREPNDWLPLRVQDPADAY